MSTQTESRAEQTRTASSSRPYRYSIWHHPRVFRSRARPGWTWQCRCGSWSAESTPLDQRTATLAAIAHVHSRAAHR
jgi:hypothetical protein